MPPYHLATVPPLTIGAGTRREVGPIARNLAGAGARVMLVADPGLDATGRTSEMEALLGEAGLAVERFDDFKSDPTLVQADAAAALARRCGARLVVALGGGSALDLGKAAAAIAGANAPAATYALCASPLPFPLPCVLVPTTAGTGSETTRVAVLSGADGAKLWFWGDQLRAAHAILDPEVTTSLPPGLTAATGMDALVHAIEAATNRRATPGNDLYAHAAIRLVATHLPVAVATPDDLPAREGLLRAAALAGTAIDNAGTAMAHALAHALASLRPVHHGRAVGAAMLASLGWVAEHDAEGRFAACGRALGAPAGAEGLVAAFAALARRVGLDTSLPEFAGVSPEALASQLARPENRPMVDATARPATDHDLLALCRRVLAQG